MFLSFKKNKHLFISRLKLGFKSQAISRLYFTVQYIYCLCCRKGHQIQTKTKIRENIETNFSPLEDLHDSQDWSQMWTSCAASLAKSVFPCCRHRE